MESCSFYQQVSPQHQIFNKEKDNLFLNFYLIDFNIRFYQSFINPLIMSILQSILVIIIKQIIFEKQSYYRDYLFG